MPNFTIYLHKPKDVDRLLIGNLERLYALGPGAVACLEKSTLVPYPKPHDLLFDGSEGLYLKSVCLKNNRLFTLLLKI